LFTAVFGGKGNKQTLSLGHKSGSDMMPVHFLIIRA